MYEKKETREKNYDAAEIDGCLKKMPDSPLSVGLSIKADNVHTTRDIYLSLMHIADCLGVNTDGHNKDFVMSKEPTDGSFISRDESIYTEQRELLEYALYVTKKLTEFANV